MMIAYEDPSWTIQGVCRAKDDYPVGFLLSYLYIALHW